MATDSMDNMAANLDWDPEKIRADFPILNQEIHRQKPLIYFDNAASTQRPKAVIQAMIDSYQLTYANVHRGTHWLSEESSRLYEEARVKVQQYIGADWTNEIIFTAGTTASINTVARSWGDQNIGPGDSILLTIMEHHSNIVPWQQLAERVGAKIEFTRVTDDGRLDIADFQSKLKANPKLVAFCAVSNTLGTINPVKQLTSMAQQAGAVVMVDAAQHVPHEPMNVTDWGVDFAAFSSHKMLGPSGIGVLYGRREILESMPAFLGGGSMIQTVTTAGFTEGDLPAKFEAGTPPITQAIGLAAAIDYLKSVGIENVATHERKLATTAHDALSKIDGLRILGPSPEHTCGIVSFVIDGVSAQDVSVLLDLQGIAIRVGHHCTMPLHNHLKISASCRASFYLYNTEQEVQQFANGLSEVLRKLR